MRPTYPPSPSPKTTFKIGGVERAVNFNRAARRAVGLVRGRGGPERVSAPASLPRYIRRHYSEGIITNPTTRRQRRHRARIQRAVQKEMR